jgi:hypothetical protein
MTKLEGKITDEELLRVALYIKEMERRTGEVFAFRTPVGVLRLIEEDDWK